MDFATVMQASLGLVFGERDPTRRISTIRNIYHEDAERARTSRMSKAG